MPVVRDFVSFDVEATGLSPAYDEIIEIGAVRYRDGAPVARFDRLVNPGFSVGGFIEDLTGITDEMLKDAPRIGAVLPEFLKFVGEALLVGHNTNFDVNFIYDACLRLGLPPLRNDFIDTMRIARRLHKDWPNHRLDTLIDRLGLAQRDKHRADNDAQLTGDAYLIMQADPGYADATRIRSYSGGTTLRAAEITAREGFMDESSPFYGRVCVFTGALESMTRREAMQLVADIGGICGDGVTKATNFLILGNNDYCKSIKDGKSSKQKKAEKLILAGADLQIIPETVFLDMLSEGQ